jgi:hypothetical protein
VTNDPPDGPLDPEPGQEPEPGPEQDPPDPEPWRPMTDPRLPGPRANLVLKIDITTEEPDEFAASLVDELLSALRMVGEPGIEVIPTAGINAVVVLTITVVLSDTTTIVLLASVLNSWLSRMEVQRISILYRGRVLTLEETPVDVDRIASLLLDGLA